MKQLKMFIIIFLITFLLYLVVYFIPRKYEVRYNIDGYLIIETGNKNNMNFLVNKDNYSFEYNYENKYSAKRHLISNIDEYSNNDNLCLYLNIKNYNSIPICQTNNEYVDFRLLDDFDFSKYTIKTNDINTKINDNLTLNNTHSNYIAVWNYKGIIYFNGDQNKTIDIFNKDYYDVPLNYVVNNYLFIPDYDSEYYFKKAYILDLKNGKLNSLSFDYEISFDSTIIGHYDNNIYLIDKKNKVEYEINCKKRIINLIETPFIYQNNKKIETNINKLINNTEKFTYNYYLNYFIDNDQLYYQLKSNINKTLITNQDKPIIIYRNLESVYYLVKDKLYEYNISNGEQLLITNYEWQFNYLNQIYIFK